MSFDELDTAKHTENIFDFTRHDRCFRTKYLKCLYTTFRENKKRYDRIGLYVFEKVKTFRFTHRLLVYFYII